MSAAHDHGSKGCKEIFERLSEYLDGETEQELRARIDGHMSDCVPCAAFLESLRRTVAWIRDVDDPPMTAERREELRRACREFLDGDDGAPVGRAE